MLSEEVIAIGISERTEPDAIALLAKNLFDDKKNKIDQLKVKVELLNPNNILDKGYSIVYKDNKVVKDITTLTTANIVPHFIIFFCPVA